MVNGTNMYQDLNINLFAKSELMKR